LNLNCFLEIESWFLAPAFPSPQKEKEDEKMEEGHEHKNENIEND